MLVKIIKCSHIAWWYKNQIGKKFRVKHEEGSKYSADYIIVGKGKDLNGVYSYLSKSDCRILSNNPRLKVRTIRCL